MAQVDSRMVVPLPLAAVAAGPTEARLVLRPYVAFSLLLAASMALAVADLVTLWLDERLGSEQLRRVFDVDNEQSVPTWFSSIQLFAAHAILLLLAWLESHRRSPHAGYWWFLAAILLVLSVDELAGFHENGSLVLSALGFGGDWIILGALVAGAVGVAFIPFLLALPRQIAAIFVAGGGILLAGALGVEVWDLRLVDEEKTLLSGLVPAFEEFLERLGISIFILGLLLYVKEHLGLKSVALN